MLPTEQVTKVLFKTPLIVRQVTDIKSTKSKLGKGRWARDSMKWNRDFAPAFDFNWKVLGYYGDGQLTDKSMPSFKGFKPWNCSHKFSHPWVYMLSSHVRFLDTEKHWATCILHAKSFFKIYSSNLNLSAVEWGKKPFVTIMP